MTADAPKFHPTNEHGNALRLVDGLDGQVIYVTEARSWFFWDGKRWAPDEAGRLILAARTLPRLIHEEAATLLADADRHKQWTSWARSSGNSRTIKGALDLAASDSRVRRSAADLDTDPWVLNTPEGVVDLRTGVVVPSAPKDLITKVTAGSYRPGIECPQFIKALEHATGGDKDLRDYLQLAAGYSLAGVVPEDVFFYPYGPPRSGKSTTVEPLRFALGDYGISANVETFLARARSGNGASEDIARMRGARMVVTSEPKEGEKLAEEFIKKLTGGGSQTARFLFKDTFEFRPQLALWFTANNRLYVDHREEALYRRLVVIPFDHSLPEGDVDPSIRTFLEADQTAHDAVLTWAVEGCRRWFELSEEGHRKVLTRNMPASVRAASDEYRNAMNPLSEFFADHCAFGPDEWSSTVELLHRINLGRPKGREMTSKQLATNLRAVPGVEKHQPKAGKHRDKHGWSGIGLTALEAELMEVIGSRN